MRTIALVCCLPAVEVKLILGYTRGVRKAPAIVLAAGASRRLGQPKQLLRQAGETLIDRAIRVSLEAGAEPVFAVLGAHAEAIVQEAELRNAVQVVNGEWQQGIAGSIHAGLRALEQQQPDCSAVLLMVCDQPRLSAAHLRALLAAHAKQTQPAIVASAYAGIAGIPAIFPKSQFQELLALTGDTGARNLLKSPSCPLVLVAFEGGEADIDTPEDLRMLASDASGDKI